MASKTVSQFEKIKENGVYRSLQKFLYLILLPNIRFNLYKHLYHFENLGKNILFYSDIEFYNTQTSFGDNVIIGKNVNFSGSGKIVIGANTGIGPYSYVNALKEIRIGKDCQIARLCTFLDHNHYFERSDVPYTKQTSYEKEYANAEAVIIEDSCWLGEKVTVLKGVTIGMGSVIGAGAVVTKSIPPYSVAVGVPAKVIKTIKRGK